MRAGMILILAVIAVAVAVVAPWRTEAVKSAFTPEEEVRQVIDDFFRAANKQDWDTAGALFSSEFHIYTDGASGFDKDSYLKLLKEEDIKTLEMKLRDMVIRVSADGTMAWSQYRGTFTQEIRAKRSIMETAESLIFEKRGAEWKIVRAHASVKEIGGQ
jgi:ketosteroid isomerase-like protein